MLLVLEVARRQLQYDINSYVFHYMGLENSVWIAKPNNNFTYTLKKGSYEIIVNLFLNQEKTLLETHIILFDCGRGKSLVNMKDSFDGVKEYSTLYNSVLNTFGLISQVLSQSLS